MHRKYMATIVGAALLSSFLQPVASNAASLVKQPDGSCVVYNSAAETQALAQRYLEKEGLENYQGYFQIENLISALADADPQVAAHKGKILRTLDAAIKWETAATKAGLPVEISDPAPAALTDFLDAFSPVYSLIERVITPRGMKMYLQHIQKGSTGVYGKISSIQSLNQKQKNSLIALKYLNTVTSIDRSNSARIVQVNPDETHTDSIFGANRIAAAGLGLEEIIAGYEMVNDLLPSYSVTTHRALAKACKAGETDFNYFNHVSPTIVGDLRMPPIGFVPSPVPSSSAAPSPTILPSSPAPAPSPSAPSAPLPSAPLPSATVSSSANPAPAEPAPTPSPKPQHNEKDGNGKNPERPSAGEIAGVVIGVLAALGIIGVVLKQLFPQFQKLLRL